MRGETNLSTTPAVAINVSLASADHTHTFVATHLSIYKPEKKDQLVQPPPDQTNGKSRNKKCFILIDDGLMMTNVIDDGGTCALYINPPGSITLPFGFLIVVVFLGHSNY